MRRFSHVLILAAAAAMGAVPASAAPLSRMLAQSGLTPEDFDMMRAAEAKLYRNPNAQPGQASAWSNPASKAHGEVRLQSRQGNCVLLHHVTRTPGMPEARELRRRFCLTGGAWKLAP